ncbi:uncharacterized protein [Aegilops tauschii subsp. strangulata]|uniref:uncharacterized protein n=1 Tax=Aegilops tauschii subsp. strangulata TaxID=200361 RepID=UPI00098A1872
MALRMAFFQKVMSGCGALAFIWATVVLLGGFSTLIKQKDFWFVTIIVFMEATWLFNNAKSEDQFFFRLAETMVNTENVAILGRGSWQRHASTEDSIDEMMPELQSAFSSHRSYCFGFLYTSLVGYVQLAALIACIVMSSLRLRRQDYVDAWNQEDDDHKNIRLSLNIFYALVLSQCLLYFVSAIVASPLKRMFVVCLKYKLGVWGFLAVARYLQECLLKCISGDLREAVNMDLVSFAKQKLTSNSLDDQLLGIRILDHLLRIKEHKAMVLTKIRSSLDTVEKAVYMLGLKKDAEQDTRGHAARVLLELAPDLQVESFPGIFQSISSLLITHKTKISGTFSNSIRVSKELTLLGVDILDKLLTNPENRAEAKNAKNLLSKILDITSCQDEKTLDSNIDKIIVEKSLNVLRKLVSTAGETGEELRCQVSKNIHTIRNIRKFIIDYAESQPAMLAQAADILACLALNDNARMEIERSHLIIWKLISLLAEDSDEGQDSSLRVSTGVRMSAVEALVLLSAPIKENAMLNAVSGRSIMAILSETKLQDMQRIVSTLSEESAEHRIMVAKFLQNLRGYQGPHYGDQLETVNKALPKVLEAIKHALDKIEGVGGSGEPSDHEMEALMINEQGKLLESFIGLCMQICTSGNAKKFTNALRNAEITDDMFVQMLRKILELYKSPSSDAPGIRRVVIQQMNWMMARDSKYINIFLRHEMDKALKEVAQTALKLENYWFFRFDVGTFGHDESIYSLLSISPLLQAGGSGL